jgi:hypothetical protein
VNRARAPLKIFWVNNSNHEDLIDYGTLLPFGRKILQAFSGHTFVVRLAGHEVVESREKILAYQKGEHEETVTFFIDSEDNSFRFISFSPYDEMELAVDDAMKVCAAQITGEEGGGGSGCIAESVYPIMERILNQRAELIRLRDAIALRLRNYTCDDDTLETSPALSTSTQLLYDKEVTLQTLFDKDHAKIYAAEDFISDEECRMLIESSNGRLQRAAVVGGSGQATISEHRRAQQAPYAVTGETDPLW